MTRSGLVLAACFIAGCSGASQPSTAATAPSSPSAAPARVLMLTATRGFRHDSIPVAREVMSALAVSSGEFTITATEDVASVTATMLAGYDVIVFALTTGELEFDASQKSAISSFVSGGRGLIGVHSAADTLYEWPDYGRMIGAYFKEHPWTGPGTVLVEDPAHPSTTGLGDRFTLTEEFYTFRDDPRDRVHVLLRLDPLSVGASGDYPLAWTQTFGAGRTYYNALGHFAETWRDARFQRQLTGAIRWAAGR